MEKLKTSLARNMRKYKAVKDFCSFVFIYFWLSWVSVAARLFPSCGKWGPLSSCGERGFLSGCGELGPLPGCGEQGLLSGCGERGLLSGCGELGPLPGCGERGAPLWLW